MPHATTKDTAPQMLRVEDAAEYLGLSVHTLNCWRALQKGPRFIRLGRAIRYKREDLDRWVEASAVEAEVV